MANLPTNASMTGSGVTEGGFKSGLNDWLTFCRDTLGSVGTVIAVRAALGLQAMATKANVGTVDLVDGAVTTTKIAAGGVTADRLAPNAALPAGVILPYGGTTAPATFHMCFGQELSRTGDAVLFGAIGTFYGAGDGVTTFNAPDARDRTVVGKGNMGGVAAGRMTATGVGNPGIDTTVLGATGGTDRHTLSSAQMPAHTHQIVHGNLGTPQSGTVGVVMSSANSGLAATVSAGGSEAHPNVQPCIIFNYIIKR